jgi:non-specific serine/threonine protein kinase
VAVGSTLGPYRVEAVVARGGMGVVYRASEVALARPVALKVISPALASDENFRERFQRESQAAAALDHPHIVPVYAAGEYEGVLYIAMRLVEGTDLRTLIAREGPLAPMRAVQIIAQVASALDAAHGRGFVHRDVKPANILVADQGATEHAYLTDFGVSNRPGSASRLTTGGGWVGTLDYVAPEQVRGERVERYADVYGLGCVLHEALTGEVPFPRENDLAKLWAHAWDAPPSASAMVDEVPPALAAVTQRAMAKQPEERFSSTGELGAAAVAAARGDPTGIPVSTAADASTLSGLPAPLTRTVGRDEQRAQVAGLLRRGDIRLVTLLGPGGVGKSRLALEAARALERDFRDGAWFVELAATSEAEHVAGSIAASLSLIPGGGESADDALVRFLGPREALLILDNFEHVLTAADLVSTLLARCGRLKVMTSSRAPLGVQAEHRLAVEPLALPDGDGPAVVKRSPACTLLVERAQSRGAKLVVDGNNASAIAAICRRLDGLPLAIELAAARIPLLDPGQLSVRLERALEALGTGGRDAPARQRTLRATIDWSFSLLDSAEAEAFTRFGVFAGGAAIESAQEVTGAGLDALAGLVDKQLLMVRPDATGASRLLMLETVRDYARERLDADERADEIHLRHCQHFLALVERAEAAFHTHGEKEWLPKLDADAHNVREVLEWSLRSGNPSSALRLAGLLHHFWMTRGRTAEGLAYLDRTLALAGADAPRGERAAAERARVYLLGWEGAAFDWRGKWAETLSHARAALELSRDAGDPSGVGHALLLLGAFEDGVRAPPLPRQRALAEEALMLARQAGDERLAAFASVMRTIALPVEDALREIEAVAAELRRIGDRLHLSWMLGDVAYGALMKGMAQRVRPLLDEALLLARDLGYPREVAMACGNCGLEALLSGDLDRAQAAFYEQLQVCREHVLAFVAHEGLRGLAAIAARRGDTERAARLTGAATAAGSVAEDDIIIRIEREFVAPARHLLGDERWHAIETEGTALSFDEAIATALDEEPTGTGRVGPGTDG